MGKFSKGMFGNFYGKIGNIVGASWRGIDYLRSLAKPNPNRVPTAKQLEQQDRFALMTAFLTPLRDVLDVGFRNYAVGVTAYNTALSDNIRNAVTGIHPALEVDYSMIQLSKGIMPGGAGVAAVAAAGGLINYSWADNTGKGKSKATDLAVILAYSPELLEFEYTIGDATRADEAVSLALPAEYAGKEVETYIFWAAENGKEVTATSYTGTLTVLA